MRTILETAAVVRVIIVVLRRRCSSAGGPGGRGTDGGVASRPVLPVGPVSPRCRDDCLAQEPQQFRDGDRDQPGAQVRPGLLLALHSDGNGDREVEVGKQADRDPAVPGLAADHLPGIQASGLLAELVIFLTALLEPTVRA